MTDIEKIHLLAENAVTMEQCGLIRKMTDAEKEAFERNYPHALMMLGDFLILKSKEQND